MGLHLSREYANVMEELVVEEVTRQLDRYPDNLRPYINRIEVETYALNRLPALYASSLEGFERQKKRGYEQHRVEIQTAVRRGFAAVQRDPLRKSTPLISREDVESHRTFAQFLATIPDRQQVFEQLTQLAHHHLNKTHSPLGSQKRKTPKFSIVKQQVENMQKKSDRDHWDTNFCR